MKTIFLCVLMLFSFSLIRAQDQITLKNGETINAKVAEVGINEIKYYKASNAEGPVYVVSKGDVAQITYQNKTTDVFNNAPASNGQASTEVTQPVQERVIIERVPSYYRLPAWALLSHVMIDAHWPIGYYYGHGYYGHHGGHH